MSSINIGPINKKDVMRANAMIERGYKKFGVILAFDVPGRPFGSSSACPACRQFEKMYVLRKVWRASSAAWAACDAAD